MSSVPGGSGENIVYALLCGGAFVGAVSYVSESFKVQSVWLCQKCKIHLLQESLSVMRQTFCVSFQAYSTVTSDGARFNERIAEIQARPKTEWTPKPWPPKSKSTVSAALRG